jgi:hypothetical protein
MLLVMRTVAALSLLAAGCSATVVDDPQTEGVDVASVHGSIAVERVVQLEPDAEQGRVSARFLRVTGLDVDSAERLVGRVPILDTPGCAWVDPGATPPPATPRGASIELVDVGEIVVRVLDPGESAVLPLAPRAFPDVGELVSGVVYTSRDETTALPAQATYLIETSGSHLVDGFVVQVDAPAAPTGVRIGGLPLDAGEIASGEAIGLEWDRGAAGDHVYVDLSMTDDETLGVVHCAFPDEGSAEVPAALVSFPPGAVLSVTLHRHRRTTVQLDGGVDQAVVDFDFVVASRIVVADG